MNRTISSHIDSRPEKCGGRPCIAGTRIRVQDIYIWRELQGRTPEEIVTDFPQLSLADVHAAIAYYHDHKDEVEADVAAEKDFAEAMKKTHPSKLVKKLTGQNGDADSLPS
jgi:uncharacterized protein (DUF433 family)